MKKVLKNSKGFTVLFAVLVSSLLLALGLGIVAITMKEVQLSGSGRDSQLAFYAADSGAECAFYWDLKGVLGGEAFATSSDSIPADNLSNMYCAGQEKLSDNLPQDSDSRGAVRDGQNATTTFWIYMEGANVAAKPCAKVQVAKHNNSGTIKTVIDSRGYNTCDTTNPRRLERGYQINY